MRGYNLCNKIAPSVLIVRELGGVTTCVTPGCKSDSMLTFPPRLSIIFFKAFRLSLLYSGIEFLNPEKDTTISVEKVA